MLKFFQFIGLKIEAFGDGNGHFKIVVINGFSYQKDGFVTTPFKGY